VSESLVYRVRGRGTFATPFQHRGAYVRTGGSVDELLAISDDTEVEIVEPFAARVDPVAAGRLELADDEVIQALVRRRHEERPFSVSTVALPPDLAAEVADAGLLPVPGAYGRETMLERVERVHGVPVAGAEQAVNAVALPADLAPLIDCEPGAPAMLFDRLFFDRDGRKVQITRTYTNPERYVYRLELRRSS
jgi:GntR family transcriptional regulator